MAGALQRLIRLWRMVTLRPGHVWVDDAELARLRSAGERVAALQRDIDAAEARTVQFVAERIALLVLHDAGMTTPEAKMIAEEAARVPPLTADGAVDEPRMVEGVQAALAASVVEELLADVSRSTSDET